MLEEKIAYEDKVYEDKEAVEIELEDAISSDEVISTDENVSRRIVSYCNSPRLMKTPAGELLWVYKRDKSVSQTSPATACGKDERELDYKLGDKVLPYKNQKCSNGLNKMKLERK